MYITMQTKQIYLRKTFVDVNLMEVCLLHRCCFNTLTAMVGEIDP